MSRAASQLVGRFGLWRAVVAAPAMLGSVLLLLVVFGWAGRREPVVMLTWVAWGAAVCTPIGERIAVRVGCRFRRAHAAADEAACAGVACGVGALRHVW